MYKMFRISLLDYIFSVFKLESHMVITLCCRWLILPLQNDQKTLLKKMTETVARGYSSESTQHELSNARV